MIRMAINFCCKGTEKNDKAVVKIFLFYDILLFFSSKMQKSKLFCLLFCINIQNEEVNIY